MLNLYHANLTKLKNLKLLSGKDINKTFTLHAAAVKKRICKMINLGEGKWNH